MMKLILRSAGSLMAVFVAVVALNGCAAIQEKHKQHHPEASATGSPGDMGRGGSIGQMGMMGRGAGGQMGMMDKKAMCEMHGKMMSAKTPAERTAMMEERMKNMSPEMRQQHMETMTQQCK